MNHGTRLWLDGRLPATAALLLEVVVDNEHHGTPQTTLELAARLGITDRAVRYHLSSLSDAHLIFRDRHNRIRSLLKPTARTLTNV